MKTISLEYAQQLIEFAPTEQTWKMGFAESQLEGSVAAFNMLARNRIAYLGDEVGMGKTYVALAVMALLRFQQPGARIMVIAPRENIQQNVSSGQEVSRNSGQDCASWPVAEWCFWVSSGGPASGFGGAVVR